MYVHLNVLRNKNTKVPSIFYSPPVNLSANGSVDLSSHANFRQPRLQQPPGGSGLNPNNHENNNRNHTSSPDGQNSPSSSTCSKEMYANLLMQLRHQGLCTFGCGILLWSTRVLSSI